MLSFLWRKPEPTTPTRWARLRPKLKTWSEFFKTISELSEDECYAALVDELNNTARKNHIMRSYQRFSKLRRDRELQGLEALYKGVKAREADNARLRDGSDSEPA